MVVRLENNDLICGDTDGLIEMLHLLETRALFFLKNDAFNAFALLKTRTESFLLQSELMNIYVF